VVAVARRPEALNSFAAEHAGSGRLKVVAGDIMDPGPNDRRLTAILHGADAAVFAAGVAGPWRARGGTWLYSEGGGAVLRAMRAEGCRMLVAVTSHGVLDDPGSPLMYRWVVKPLLLSQVYEDMRAFEQDIARCSPWLNFAILRPTRLVVSWSVCMGWVGLHDDSQDAAVQHAVMLK